MFVPLKDKLRPVWNNLTKWLPAIIFYLYLFYPFF
jgi:hypothetical protein